MNNETLTKRHIATILKPDWVSDGAGVKIKRVIASSKLDHVDPFLLLDEFKSDNPGDYIAGFPMHPHRGIETVTYMLAGQIKHEDSIGSAGVIGPGDVQWMTAGSGIIHSEMPEQKDGLMWGFQLWVNLPSKKKPTQPRYQEIPGETIPAFELKSGVKIKVIAGNFGEFKGPVKDVAADPVYLDISMPRNQTFTHKIPRNHSTVAYVFDGKTLLPGNQGKNISVGPSELVVFEDGDQIEFRTEKDPARFLLLAGRPFNEPIVRYGPFAMNSWEEIETAFREMT